MMESMTFGYADPSYLGQGKKLYGDHIFAADYDDPSIHKMLIEALSEGFPDGWALSASSVSLRAILPMCPEDVRVCSWVKPFCAFKPNVGLAYAWEPVIVRGGRRISRSQPTVRDWCAENITLKRGLIGAKPARVARWIFSMLNAVRGDILVDIFPGSGAVTAAWDEWTQEGCPPEVGGARQKEKA